MTPLFVVVSEEVHKFKVVVLLYVLVAGILDPVAIMEEA